MAELEPTVYVVDDDALVRRSLERLIRMAGFKVRTFESAQDFLGYNRSKGPACMVLDVHLAGLSGLDLQRELSQSSEQIPIIFLTGHGDIPMSVRAMKAGAVEFLTKPVKQCTLLEAIHAAVERDRATFQARAATENLRARYEQLTPREREVMRLVVTGLLNKQMADELNAAERTIKFHRSHLMQKMGAESLAELVRMAEKLRISPRAD